MDFVDAGFTMDIFMVDSNAMDAKDLDKDSEHNICGAEHNPAGATCASAGEVVSFQQQRCLGNVRFFLMGIFKHFELIRVQRWRWP